MFIYRTNFEYKDIPVCTFLKFNKSFQRFESFDKQYMITNDESFRHPYLIVIDREILPTNRQRTSDWNPFAKDIKDWIKRK